MRVLVIIPAYNESASILQVVAELRRIAPDYDHIVINDGSSDNTIQLLQGEGIPYLNLAINLGIGAVVQTGYCYALQQGYDYAIQLDGDGQHDPAYLQILLAPLVDNCCDLVIGSRFLGEGSYRSTALRRFGIACISQIIRLCCGVSIRDATSGFRGINRSLMEFYSVSYAQDYPEPEAILAAALAGFTILEVPVGMRSRQGGISSIDGPSSLYYMIKVSLALLLLRLQSHSGGHKRGV